MLSYLCLVIVAHSSHCGILLTGTPACRKMKLPSFLFRYPMKKFQVPSGPLKPSKLQDQMASMRDIFSGFGFLLGSRLERK